MNSTADERLSSGYPAICTSLAGSFFHAMSDSVRILFSIDLGCRSYSLYPQESYDMLEIVEARCRKSTIFCTQYESEGWYTRIDPNPESDSPVSEAIMDRIIHNAYEVLVDGRVSMRERKGLKAAREGGGQDT